MKSKPTTFSIDDLVACPDQTDHWDGVRNYQARVLSARRDSQQRRTASSFTTAGENGGRGNCLGRFEKAIRTTLPWIRKAGTSIRRARLTTRLQMVDIRFETKFNAPLPLPHLRQFPELAEMLLLKKGMRLSIQPVTRSEFEFIVALAR